MDSTLTAKRHFKDEIQPGGRYRPLLGMGRGARHRTDRGKMLNFLAHVAGNDGKDNVATFPLGCPVLRRCHAPLTSTRSGPAASGKYVDVHTSARLLTAATQACQEAWPAGATGRGDSPGFDDVIQSREAIADSTRRFKMGHRKKCSDPPIPTLAGPQFPRASPFCPFPCSFTVHNSRDQSGETGCRLRGANGHLRTKTHLSTSVALKKLQHATFGSISDLVRLRSISTSTTLAPRKTGGKVRKPDRPALMP